MKIPAKMKIGGHFYLVKLVEPEDIEKVCGEVDRSKLEIKINNNLPQSQLEETLIHESLHAINMDIPEKEIEYLSSSIYQVLKDNNLLR